MTPEDVAKRCAEWATGWARRVEYVEPDGERRTWLLYEGGRQVGHVRLRWVVGVVMEPRPQHAAAWFPEAAGSGRDILGLAPLPTP